jgi:ketopantoate reductase
MSNNPPNLPRSTRVEALLDAALDKVAEQIEAEPVPASLLREIVQLARSMGIDLAQHGQSMSPAGEKVQDSVLASMADLDLKALGLDDESVSH